VYPTRPTKGVAPSAPAAPPEDTSIPETPPAEVLHALDQAQCLVSELASKNLELRFEVGDGPVRAQLVNSSDGRVVREMPARLGLDMLAGNHLVDHQA